MWVRILGNSSGGPFQGRHYSAQWVHNQRDYFLVDCGEGTQEQLYRYQLPVDRVNQIFITHLHGDHVFGLFGLLTSYSLKGRQRPIQLYSPPGLSAFIQDVARHCGIRFSFPMEFIEVGDERPEKVFESETLEVSTVPLRHGTCCVGWLFREKPRPLNIRPESIEQYGLTFEQIRAVKAGADLTLPDGRVVANGALTLPPKPLLSYAYCSDTAPSEAVAEAVCGVSLLYHEATFTDEHIEEAAAALHSTARQAAEVARTAQAGKLLLGHFSGRYADTEQHVRQAREVFPNVEAAVEGVEYAVGEPTEAV